MLSDLIGRIARRRTIAVAAIVLVAAFSVGVATASGPMLSGPWPREELGPGALRPQIAATLVPAGSGESQPRAGGFVVDGPGEGAQATIEQDNPRFSVPDYDCLQWRVVTHPAPITDPDVELWDVKALAANNAWAVGDYFGQQLIEHWDGNTWTIALSGVPGWLHGIAAVSANDIWAVGGANGTALTMHWNGASWIAVPNPGPPTSALYAVSARAANDVWAVGTTGSQGSWRAFSMRWNGTAWSVVNTPQPPNSGDQYELYGVTAVAANDVWAVGDYDVAGDYTRWIIMRWNGTAWSVWTGLNSSTIGHLRDVAAVSANDIWAVGSRGSVYGISMDYFPAALHWDGVQWASYYTPLPEGTMYGLSARATNDVWAVGTLSGYESPITMHWDGVAWWRLPGQSAQSGYLSQLFAVSAVSSSDVWAVGRIYDEYYDSSRSLIERHSPGPCPTPAPSRTPTPTPTCGWSQVTSPNRPTGGNSLYGMAVVSSNDIWAVGTGGGRTLVIHWNGTTWSEVPSPSPGSLLNVLYGVTVVSPIDIWAVGAYSYGERTVAMTMRWNGATWSLIGVPNPGWDFSELRGVDWAAGGALWAVGSFGDGGARYTFVLRWNGTAWDMVPSPNPHPWDQGLNAIAAVSANDIWAVGYKDSQYEEGLIIRWTGSAWNIVSPPSYAWGTLRAVVAVSANDVWATGDLDGYPNTPLWHWNGTAWTVVTYQSTEPVDVHGLAAVSAADIWAVGAVWSGMGYAAAHWNGTAWYPDTTAILSAYEPLNAVAAASPADLWTVGSLGDPYQPHRQTTLVMRNTQPCPDPVNTPTRTPTPLPTNTPTRTPTPYPTPTVCPGCCPIYFPDVPIINTFYPFIRCLACRDILSGYADGTFRPNNPVTRGQLSKIVSNSAGFSDPPGAQLFQDVPPGSTFHDWVQRLASRSIMSGYACGGVGEPCVPPQNRPYFRPNNNATRGQISKIVSNAAGFSEPPGTQLFEDVAPGSTFYDWVQRLASRSIMSGYPCGGAGEPCVPPQNRPYFRPNNNATRGQTAKIVANTFFPNCQTPNKR